MVESTVLGDSRCVFPGGAKYIVYKQLLLPECSEMLWNTKLFFFWTASVSIGYKS